MIYLCRHRAPAPWGVPITPAMQASTGLCCCAGPHLRHKLASAAAELPSSSPRGAGGVPPPGAARAARHCAVIAAQSAQPTALALLRYARAELLSSQASSCSINSRFSFEELSSPSQSL